MPDLDLVMLIGDIMTRICQKTEDKELRKSAVPLVSEAEQVSLLYGLNLPQYWTEVKMFHTLWNISMTLFQDFLY